MSICFVGLTFPIGTRLAPVSTDKHTLTFCTSFGHPSINGLGQEKNQSQAQIPADAAAKMS
jgi:hypothetical protein